MSFLGFGGNKGEDLKSGAGSASIPADQREIIEQVKKSIAEEVATTYATTLVNSLSDNCFEKCIKVQTDFMTSEQNKCVEDCSAKFMRAWNVVSKSYVSRINQK